LSTKTFSLLNLGRKEEVGTRRDREDAEENPCLKPAGRRKRTHRGGYTLWVFSHGRRPPGGKKRKEEEKKPFGNVLPKTPFKPKSKEVQTCPAGQLLIFLKRKKKNPGGTSK